MSESLSPREATLFRERRKANGIGQVRLASAAAVRVATIGEIERGVPQEVAIIKRALVALAALEMGFNREKAHELSLKAAPIQVGGKRGDHTPKYGPDKSRCCPEHEPLPAMCFSGMDVKTISAGRISLPEPSVMRTVANG